MSFKVSKKARSDLKAIGRHTQKIWGVEQRRKYLNGINEKFGFLADNPLICRLRTEFSPPIRIHHHEKHLIVYVVEDTDIYIIRVLYEGMQIEDHISEE